MEYYNWEYNIYYHLFDYHANNNIRIGVNMVWSIKNIPAWQKCQATRDEIKALVQEGQDKGLPVRLLNDDYVAFGDIHIHIWKKGNVEKIKKLIKNPTLESWGIKE